MTIVTKSVKETQKVAGDLAKKIIKSAPQKNAAVIALEGELGAGKTTFAKSFARELGVKGNITSPTFVLLKAYSLQLIAYSQLIHIDAYRLKDSKELKQLGIKEMISNPQNIILIEWAERVKPILPANCITVHIDHLGKDKRKIKI